MPESRDHFWGRHYDALHSTGPLGWFNPTKRYLAVAGTSDESPTPPEATDEHRPAIVYVWRSRDNRKGRHPLAVRKDPRKDGAIEGPKPTNTAEQTLKGIAKMFLVYPIWDVSYDVAFVFTIGSIIWVINGFFAWLPLAAPDTEFSGETTWASGVTATVGATVFEFGSVLLMLEAANENRSDCFGWAVEETVEGILHIRPKEDCQHSHAESRTFLKGQGTPHRGNNNNNGEASSSPPPGAERTWQWWPSWYELRTHYLRDIGFLACLSQMIGATIFWIAGIASLPPLLDRLSVPATNGVYWATQVIGGTGFIVSSLLFMLEVQPRWYVPAPGVLGWHIGFWNLVGAVGFTLCGALGFGASHPGVTYALNLASFLGSWSFLIGSVIQLYESLNKYPVWVDKGISSLKAS